MPSTKKFFMKYLGAKSNDGYHNQITGFCSYFLTFEDGARIEIMNLPEMADLPKEIVHTGYSHIAFSVESIEKVDALTRPVSSLPIDFPPSATPIVLWWCRTGISPSMATMTSLLKFPAAITAAYAKRSIAS